MYQPGPHPADRRRIERRAHHRHQRRRARGHLDAVDVDAAPVGVGHRAARWQGARHRRQRGREPAHRRQQHRRDLESRDRHVDAGRARRERAALSLRRPAAAGCVGAHRRRRRARPAQVNLNAEIYYPPYLFDAAGARAARPAIVSAPDTVLPGATFQVGYSERQRHQPRIAHQDRLDHAQREHGPAPAAAAVHARTARCSTCSCRRAPAMCRRATTCCSC